MIKLINLKTGCINTIKVKFIGTIGFADVTNNSLETLIFSNDQA